MFIDEKQIVSVDTTNIASFFDKIVYSLEYGIAIVLSFGLFSFIYFYLIRNSEGVGMLFLFIYILLIASLGSIAARFVYKDVKKFQAKGINTKNSAWGWSVVTFTYPFIGFCWYMACRKADYKKQIPNIQIENISNNI